MSDTADVISAQARRVWMVRLDRTAAAERAALESGLLTYDAGVRADLSDHFEFEQVLDEVMIANPGEAGQRLDAMARQLHSLLHDIQAGDLVVVPLRVGGRIAVGQFRPDHGMDADDKPGRRVQWIRTDIARQAFMQDLLYSFGAKQRVCEISRNNALKRIETVLAGGVDPGNTVSGATLPEDPDVLESLLRKRMMLRMGTIFSGHALAGLVGEILKAKGYQVRVGQPGPDGGVDIYAGTGALGTETGLVVQVKSGDQVTGVETLQQLEGAMRSSKASQGLLVSWGGFSRSAAARTDPLWYEIRLWTAADVLEAFVETYEHLPLDIRDAMPLRKAWIA